MRDLGIKIREVRTRKGLKLSEVAERAGVTSSYLSQVEHGTVTPSIPALQALSAALDTPAFYFFMDEDPGEPVVRAGERRVLMLPSSPASYELCSPTLKRNLEILVCKLSSGAATHGEPFTHRGEEAAFVLCGRVEVTVGDRCFILGPGDCLQFESSVPHRYTNVGDHAAEILITMSPPL